MREAGAQPTGPRRQASNKQPLLATPKRHISTWFLVSLLMVLAVGGASGAAMFFYSPDGSRIGMTEMLQSLPVGSLVLPGLVLLVVMCLIPALLAYGIVSRPSWRWAQRLLGWRSLHWSWWGSVLEGVILVLWLVVQATYIGFRAPAQYFTAVLTLLILVVALMPSARRTFRVGSPVTSNAGMGQEED